jgi:hypothetical protein
MLRSASLLITFTLIAAPSRATPPASPAEAPAEDARKINTLAVQQAMASARQHLRESQPKKAVDLLEEQLNRAGGNPGYLDLLRDAYCALIRQSFVDSQNAVAQRYLQRLSILDPGEAKKLTVPAEPAPVKFVAPDRKEIKMPLPNFAAQQADQEQARARPPQVIATTGNGKPATARGKLEGVVDDPFDRANERLAGQAGSLPHRQAGSLSHGAAGGMPHGQATDLLARANEEFTRRRYKEARGYYEQACRADQRCAELCRDSFAYCVLSDVVEHLNQPGFGGRSINDLQKDIHGAMNFAPKLAPTGQWLLREIDQRHKTQTVAAPGSLPEPPLPMQHYGRNPQGWMVSETPYFRIFHNQPRELVEKVAQIAERTRAEMQRKWFGSDACDWEPKCELVLHATAADYSRLTGVPTASPGHSRIETDPVTKRVIGRRMDLHIDNPGMLEAVLPHETTHAVLAGQFGPYQVPRWADEGIAVLTEPREKVEQHRRNLVKASREGELFQVKELMELDNYPQPRRVGAFYAQSVSLVEFLVQQKGAVAFTEFIRDGLKQGYEASLRKHYGWDFATLGQQWAAQTTGSPAAVSGRPALSAD